MNLPDEKISSLDNGLQMNHQVNDEFVKDLSIQTELTSEQKLEALVNFDEKGSPDKMTEEQKLEFQKRQWELFEQGWKNLGRKGRRKMIKSEGKYSSKLKQRLKNI